MATRDEVAWQSLEQRRAPGADRRRSHGRHPRPAEAALAQRPDATSWAATEVCHLRDIEEMVCSAWR
jgi:hypothetical protein